MTGCIWRAGPAPHFRVHRSTTNRSPFVSYVPTWTTAFMLVTGFSYTSPRLTMTVLLRLVEPYGGCLNCCVTRGASEKAALRGIRLADQLLPDRIKDDLRGIV